MHSRLFKRVLSHSSNLPYMRYSTSARPVLLIGEEHSRPAGKIAIKDNLTHLKRRGFNIFMSERISLGNTIDQRIAEEQSYQKGIAEISKRIPSFMMFMQCRYNFNYEDLYRTCETLLKEATPPFDIKDDEEMRFMITQISYYSESEVTLYQQLKSEGFSYQNLDQNYSSCPSRPDGSRQDADYRDEQYANFIMKAHQEGKNAIVLLGGLHVLSDPFPADDEKMWPRKTMAERLREKGIPSITLYPFNSDHVQTGREAAALEKRTYDFQKPLDPLTGYAVDMKEPKGSERFMQLVDMLSFALHVQTQEENRMTLRR